MRKQTWDLRFLGLAQYVANSFSKDPSTKVGAIITRPDHSVASIGYNGFPKGCDDDPSLYEDRTRKYPRVVHAELNAISFSKESLAGCTLFVWFPVLDLSPCCSTCTGVAIQSGISRIVGVKVPGHPRWDAWKDDLAEARKMLDEAGVEVTLLPFEEV